NDQIDQSGAQIHLCPCVDIFRFQSAGAENDPPGSETECDDKENCADGIEQQKGYRQKCDYVDEYLSYCCIDSCNDWQHCDTGACVIVESFNRNRKCVRYLPDEQQVKQCYRYDVACRCDDGPADQRCEGTGDAADDRIQSVPAF